MSESSVPDARPAPVPGDTALESAVVERRGEENPGVAGLTVDELKDGYERLADFMSTASDLLWETDAQMKVIRGERIVKKEGEKAVVTGMSRRIAEMFVGRTTSEVLSRDPSTDPELARYLSAIQARKPYRGFEFSVTLPDRVLWFESGGNPIFDDTGKFTGYRGTARDITRRKTDEAVIETIRGYGYRLGPLPEFGA